MGKNNDLVSHMQKVAKTVESWPSWKKNALGTPKPNKEKEPKK